MIAKVQVHPKVEKAIKQMKTWDNAPKIAAQRAQEIINSLITGSSPSHVGRLSRKKDVRVKNVFKFNLGKGFRLVTVKEKDILFILHIGSHDHCGRYLDAYRKKKPHNGPLPLNIYNVAGAVEKNLTSPTCLNERKKKENMVPKISQEDLRKIFKGLVRKANSDKKIRQIIP